MKNEDILLIEKTMQNGEKPLDIFRAIEAKDRKTVSELVMRDDVSLGLTSSLDGRSLLHSLLNKSCNGDKLVLKKLDSCISTSNQDPDSEDFSVIIDHSKLVGSEDPREMRVLHDIVRLPRPVCRRVLHHPVIVTYIQDRWSKTRWSFLYSFILYLFFVFLYSTFLGMMYWRNINKVERIMLRFPSSYINKIEIAQDDSKVGFPDPSTRDLSTNSPVRFLETPEDGFEYGFVAEKKPKNRTKSRIEIKIKLFTGCFYSEKNICAYPGESCRDILLCLVELFLVLSLLLLVLQELWQCIALKAQYFQELENWFEIIIISFAISALALKQDLNEMKIVAAVGICFAWLELIFLFGRYPCLGGSFSIMYYTATKRLIKTALGFGVLIFAFSFAFFIIHCGSESESFSNVFRASLKTLVMVTGEFEFENLYKESAEDDLVLGFTMFILLCLVVFGSVIMLNLIVATIITDMDWLRQMSKEQILLNQAHHALQVNALLSVFSRLANRVHGEKSRFGAQLEFCVHNICSCGRPRLPSQSSDVVFRILKMS